MPSSTDRKRLEIPTYLHDRIVEIAIDEDRTVASVAQQVIAAGLGAYQPGLVAELDFSRFAPRAHAAIDAARAETVPFNHNFIGTEHLLLGLLKVEDGFAARVLGGLGVDYARCLQFMQARLQRGIGAVPPPAELHYAPRAKKALRFAIEEADKMDNHNIGTEHILLSLTRVRDGVAAGILTAFGVLDAIRDATLNQIEQDRTSYWWQENAPGYAANESATPATEEPSDAGRDRAIGEAGGA